MPLTTAEKSKRYREKLKTSNPEKYEAIKKKSIERALKSYKRKVVDMTAEQREEQRKKWRALNNIKRNNQHTEQPTTSTSQKEIPNIKPEIRVTATVRPDSYIQVSEEVVISDSSEFPEPFADVEVRIQQPPELHHAGLESPVSQPQPARRRRRLRHNRTSLNSNSSTTILNQWMKELERNKLQAEKKMAAASLMIAEAANKIADASLMNAETNRMNAETNRMNAEMNRKQLEVMKAIKGVVGQPGQPSSARLRAEDSSQTENEMFFSKCNTAVLQTLNEKEGRNAGKRQEPPEKRCRARKIFRQTDSSSEADISDDNDDDNEQSSNCHEKSMLGETEIKAEQIEIHEEGFS